MKIACFGYRSWAIDIYTRLVSETDHSYFLFQNKADLSLDLLNYLHPDYILFYGWSWLIPGQIIKNYKCLMLHPSRLPQYRGGSPIQNQIIRGDYDSAVTIFHMDEGVDTGPILKQSNLSLLGSLSDIFARITDLGVSLTLDIFNNGFISVPQDESAASCFKRRLPSDSEITLDELQHSSATYLNDKIRMLADPYPNAFIRTVDGRKLIIKLAEIKD